jgi:Fe-S-cluster-containing dehydrogenase component
VQAKERGATVIHVDPRWLFLSDICKHCENAGCLEACPTGAIARTEFGTVVIQQDICNGWPSSSHYALCLPMVS